MPCVQARERAERDEYIRKHRRDLNLFEGIEDPVEVLKVMHQRKEPDPLVNFVPYPTSQDAVYAALSPNEQVRLADHAAALLEAGDIEQASSIALCLAAFTSADLAPLLRAFVLADHFYPGLFYRQAPPDIRDLLLWSARRGGGDRRHILVALAWVGDESVVSQFYAWRRRAPLWSAGLDPFPQSCVHAAGWELSESGQRRDLCSAVCHALKNVPLSDEKRTVAILSPAPGSCHWCRRRLSNLVDLDFTDPRFASLHLPYSRLSIATCDVCTCYGCVFTRLGVGGQSVWSEHNCRPEYLPPDAKTRPAMPEGQLWVSVEPRRPLHAASWSLPTTFSQIGGHPTWIQRPEYPECPVCGKTMPFLAQVACEEVYSYAEGIYYVYLCRDCGIAATGFQQS